jgi:hypothetical protein
MKATSFEQAIKLFAISNQIVEHELDRVEEEFAIDLARGHAKAIDQDETYYPQIDRSIRQEAARMARHYEVFYSLEKSIRSLVADTLVAGGGEQWWSSGRVPTRI